MRTADEAPDPATTSRCEACRKPLDTGVVVIELNAETMIALGGDPWTDLSRKYVFRTDCAQQARDLLDWLQREGGARR